MKAEERHELQTNDLESFLYYRLPHYLRQYGSYILLAAALAFLGYTLWSRWEQKKEVHIQTAWQMLTVADRKAFVAFQLQGMQEKVENPVEAYNEVLATYADVRPVASEAHLKLANFYNSLVLAGNPDVAGVKIGREDAMKLARAEYETVIREFADRTANVADAKLGLASLLENDAKFDEAKAIYEEMAAAGGSYSGTPYESLAKRKLEQLPKLREPAKFGPREIAVPAATLPAGFGTPGFGSGIGQMPTTVGPATTSAPASAPATSATKAAATNAATAPKK